MSPLSRIRQSKCYQQANKLRPPLPGPPKTCPKLLMNNNKLPLLQTLAPDPEFTRLIRETTSDSRSNSYCHGAVTESPFTDQSPMDPDDYTSSNYLKCTCWLTDSYSETTFTILPFFSFSDFPSHSLPCPHKGCPHLKLPALLYHQCYKYSSYESTVDLHPMTINLGRSFSPLPPL